jgi:hypothetical protein
VFDKQVWQRVAYWLFSFLSWMSQKATKGLISLTSEIDGDGLTTCYVGSIPHHQPINVPTAEAQAFLMNYT